MTASVLRKKIYVLDVNFGKDIGGAGKASKDIILGLTDIYDVIFIPKYAEIKNVRDAESREEFSKFANLLLDQGISIPSLIMEYVMSKSDHLLSGFIQIITAVVEQGAIVLDLNYFPYLEPLNLDDLVKEFFFRGEIYYLKKYNRCKVISLLQTLDNRPIKSNLDFAIKSSIKFHYFDLHFLFKSFYRDLKDEYVVSKFLKFSDMILLYSSGSLASLKVKKYDKEKFRILKVGNTIDKQLIVSDKEKYILYYARLIPEKGIFDILFVLGKIIQHCNVKLLITGQFKNNDVKEAFLRMSEKYDLTKYISYLGYVSEHELDKLIKEAKVFLYPTHYDSFPYSIMESIIRGTPVVTYAIPTVLSIYGQLKCVNVVEEFDFVKMAEKTLKLLRSDTNELKSMFENESVKDFIKRHEKKRVSTNEIANYIMEV